MKSVIRAFLVATMLMPIVAQAQEVRLNPEDRNTIIQEVIRYFQDNPDQLLKQRTKQSETVSRPDVDTQFIDAAQTPWEGNPNADYTILVFSAYGCEICRSTDEAINTILATRDDVLVSYKDIPSRDKDAITTSLDLMTVFNSEGMQIWKKFRDGIIKYGVEPENRIRAYEEAGLTAISEPSDETKIAMFKNRELARRAGVQEVPAVIVMKGDRVVPISGKITKELVDQALTLLSSRTE